MLRIPLNHLEFNEWSDKLRVLERLVPFLDMIWKHQDTLRKMQDVKEIETERDCMGAISFLKIFAKACAKAKGGEGENGFLLGSRAKANMADNGDTRAFIWRKWWAR